jgi:hypothetical protein
MRLQYSSFSRKRSKKALFRFAEGPLTCPKPIKGIGGFPPKKDDEAN